MNVFFGSNDGSLLTAAAGNIRAGSTRIRSSRYRQTIPARAFREEAYPSSGGTPTPPTASCKSVLPAARRPHLADRQVLFC